MKISWKAVVAVGLALAVLYAANFLYAVFSDQSGGTFGDTFGAVNALFSGSALFFLVLAFISQREELELVKEERNDTRKILTAQESLNTLQRQALDRQIFEQKFFSLFSILGECKDRLDGNLEPKNVGGTTRTTSIEKCYRTSEKTLQSFSADPCSIWEYKERLHSNAETLVLFLEALFATHRLLKKSVLPLEEKGSYAALIKAFNTQYIACCALAYGVCATIDDLDSDLEEILTISGLVEYIPEGTLEYHAYFESARHFARK